MEGYWKEFGIDMIWIPKDYIPQPQFKFESSPKENSILEVFCILCKRKIDLASKCWWCGTQN